MGHNLVIQQVALQLILVGEYLCAEVTPKPLFSCVAQHVALERHLLNEGVRADAALVLLFASVDAPMVHDMLSALECPAAHITLKGALIRVYPLMYDNPGLPPVHVRAVPACIHCQSRRICCFHGNRSNVSGLANSSTPGLCHYVIVYKPLCVQ